MIKLQNIFIRNTSILFVYGCLLLLISCTEGKPEKKIDESIDRKNYVVEKNEVEILILKKGIFNEELLSNGKLVAVQKNDLKFEVPGKLNMLFVKEGDAVKENTVLAILDKYKYKEELISAETTLKKALLELEDMLVNRGYDLKRKNEIPKQVYDMAGLRSGYTEALQKIKSSKYNVNSTSLTAPFSGKIAAIKNKLHDQITAGSIFLTLINDTYFDVIFPITESEINKVLKGNQISVFAMGVQKEYKGKVVSINPLVEKNGTIQIKARVKNDGNLIDGMNVKISMEKQIHNQFIIPKSAIVLRQDQEVLFKVKKGKAFWTYVKTVNENKDYYTVIPNPDKNSATLKVGDTIITKGNLNLAHDSEVKINYQIKKISSGIKN
ncbi:Macrolide export protein MacA [Polaribacter huanghezhanensis]|uniref:efflux RND transporter periplasmic adaptor subunit n=1 Tax=Polaribacter huanghezhanensis TaxID=1354726 RepID=UPI00264890A6|nr:efflux RND transporter periplasmic adaptor subunit [Polaribacter huanghezhanensis]WKD85241.1 Macrolide export protein MacA [Polaribacter huanghezhanensis]